MLYMGEEGDIGHAVHLGASNNYFRLQPGDMGAVLYSLGKR